MLSVYLSIIDDPEDQSRFEKLYYEYNAKLISFAFKLSKDKFDAEEIVQTAMFKVAENIHLIKSNDENVIKSYVFRVLKNTAIDFLRKKNKNPQIIDIDSIIISSYESSIEEEIAGGEEYLSLIKRINNLPDVYKDVLILRLVYDIPEKDIAKLLGRKRATVNSQLVRGKKMLKNILEGAEIK